MGKLSEKDLAEKVIGWLAEQHWEIWQEIEFSGLGGIADICAVRDNKLWIIECKTSLSMTVMYQASRWYSHFRSIAVLVSYSPERDFAYSLCRHLDIGVITVDKQQIAHQVTEVAFPPIMRENHKMAKRLIKQLSSRPKNFKSAGTNGGGYYIPYKATIEKVKNFIRTHPGCSMKQIMADLGNDHHYSSNVSARSCLRTALGKWESDWCRVDTSDRECRYFFIAPKDR